MEHDLHPDISLEHITSEELEAAIAELPVTPEKKEKTPIVPVPDDAPPCNFMLPDIGKPSVLYPYHNADGALLCYIARFETTHPDTGLRQKKILPVCYCELPNGKRGWRSAGLPKPRPLYNLPEIITRSSAPIFVCEGEKVAEAGKLLFPDYVATTPMHGAQSPRHTDWSPVKGRTVIITTDHDSAGATFGDAAHDLCSEAGAACILHLPAEELGKYRIVDGVPTRHDHAVEQGFDIADLLAGGWTARHISVVARIEELPFPYIKSQHLQGLQQALVGKGYRLTPRGVEYERHYKDENGDDATEWKWFCSYLAITHQTRDTQSHNWGVILELTDNDGNRKEYIMPMSMLAGDGVAYREELLSRGLRMAPKANNLLHTYINLSSPKARATCVQRPGWHGENFILPCRVYGAASRERIVLQQDIPQSALKIQGTLDEWQQHVGALCAGNSRLILAVSSALCGPLLHLLGEENFGLHFYGGSSVGKTTALVVAASIYGCQISSWRTTDNAAESNARQANDTLLLLDELSQVDGYSADAMAYMLGNGTTKARSRRDGSAKAVERFRLVFLSSGEMGLAAKMMECGKNPKAGQTVRFIEIPADVGTGYGLLDTIHNFPDSNRMAIAIKGHAAEYTGTVGDAYLQALTADRATILNSLIAARKAWVAEHIPADSDGQVLRVGQKFALIAAAGELGIALGLLPWPAESAAQSCARIFHDWVKARGGTQAYEMEEAKQRLQMLIAQHGSSRFETPWGCRSDGDTTSVQDARIINRAGFKRLNSNDEWEYFIIPAVFEKEVIGGLQNTAVKTYLVDCGLLVKDRAGKFSEVIKVPGHKSLRLYHVPARVLDGDAGGDHADS
jgi:putative DNA primase/helicase